MTASSKYIYGTFCQILLPLCLQSCNSLFRIMIFNYSPFYFCYPQVKRHLDYFTTDREVSLYLLSTKINISLSFSLWLPLFSYFFVLLTYFPFIFIFPTYPLPTALLTTWPAPQGASSTSSRVGFLLSFRRNPIRFTFSPAVTDITIIN